MSKSTYDEFKKKHPYLLWWAWIQLVISEYWWMLKSSWKSLACWIFGHYCSIWFTYTTDYKAALAALIWFYFVQLNTRGEL